MQIFTTSQVAKIAGVHPNTIRLYEKLGFITIPERKSNGYRIFTDVHIEQVKLARLALKAEVLQNGLRRQAIQIINTAAASQYDEAITLTRDYMFRISQEKRFAEDAIAIAENLLEEILPTGETGGLTRRQTADFLHISIDTLRNWEMNGLLTVKRKRNGYRIYDGEDIKRLKMIRALRCANYSLNAILRMLNDLTHCRDIDIKASIDTPKETEDIVPVCDRLLTSLDGTAQDASRMLHQLEDMRKTF